MPLLLLLPSQDNYEEAIRMRVIASSNSETDQAFKKEVADNLQTKMNDILKDASSLEEARKSIVSNYTDLKSTVEQTYTSKNYIPEFTMNYGYNYFPEKTYAGKKIAAGKYESLVVTLGKGEGDNWWCIMFPPLCLIEAEDNNTEEIQYEFFLEKLFNEIFK